MHPSLIGLHWTLKLGMRVLAPNSNGIETHIFCLTVNSQVLFVVSGQVWPGVITGSPQQTVVTKPVRTKGATVTGTQIVADCSAVFVQVITSPQIGPQYLIRLLPYYRQKGRQELDQSQKV